MPCAENAVINHHLFVSTSHHVTCLLAVKPFLYALYTYDCTPYYCTSSIIKFEEYTSVVTCIKGGDVDIYRAEVGKIVEWCAAKYLTPKT